MMYIRINEELERLGFYPEAKAVPVAAHPEFVGIMDGKTVRCYDAVAVYEQLRIMLDETGWPAMWNEIELFQERDYPGEWGPRQEYYILHGY